MKIPVMHSVVLLLIGFSLLNLTYVASMNFSGYCFAKNRYLTFDDKIQIMFEVANANPKVINLTGHELKVLEKVPYTSFEEYIEENPDCCSLISADNPTSPTYELSLPPPDLIERITGNHSGEVIAINYKFNYFDRNGITSENRKYIRVLTNCGIVRD